jgi:2-dehydro-3-deoxyglucarate aldolase/4-hydroxy-2-oxoheptanedioate aldolase
MPISLKQRLQAGDLLVGTIVTLASTEMIEIFCQAGFDWLFVDLEHSALSIRDAQLLLQAADATVPCLVRIPASDAVWIKKALDIGAAGIIAPQVLTAEHARQAVAACRYPPQGVRSVGIARAHGYGAGFADYVASANDEVVTVLQIEHIEAVANMTEIVAVPGIDCLFVGPYDLSASMGKLGQVGDPDVQRAIATVRQHARQAGIPLGIFGATAEAVRPFIQCGYTLLAVGIDTLLVTAAAQGIVKNLKP